MSLIKVTPKFAHGGEHLSTAVAAGHLLLELNMHPTVVILQVAGTLKGGSTNLAEKVPRLSVRLQMLV